MLRFVNGKPAKGGQHAPFFDRHRQKLSRFPPVTGSASAGMSLKNTLILAALEGGQLTPEYPGIVCHRAENTCNFQKCSELNKKVQNFKSN